MSEFTTEEEINQILIKRPHVVILGAGASRATCPIGDRNHKILPLMSDFVKVLKLNYLADLGLNINENFETLYSNLCQKDSYKTIRQKVEKQVYNYFNDIIIPKSPTIYDLLLLSLRKKDLVATFNWDPLIVQAYRRNGNKFDLPNLLFLHGNVGVGYCQNDNQCGLKGFPCNTCGKPLNKTPILYPITEKNYDINGFLNSQWINLQIYIKSAIWITFFDYSAPESDTRAIELMKTAWGNIKDRNMEQIEIINIESEEELRKSKIWEPFIHSHHYDIHKNFFDSWMAKHPRRTGEAYHNQYRANKSIHENPIPQNLLFEELWDWFSPLQRVEHNKIK